MTSSTSEHRRKASESEPCSGNPRTFCRYTIRELASLKYADRSSIAYQSRELAMGILVFNPIGRCFFLYKRLTKSSSFLSFAAFSSAPEISTDLPNIQTLAMVLVCRPTIRSISTSRHRQSSRVAAKWKQGFYDLGLFGPCCISSWSITNCVGSVPLPCRPRFDLIFSLTFPLVLCRYFTLFGRGLLTELVSIRIQGLVYYHLMAIISTIVFDLEGPLSPSFSNVGRRGCCDPKPTPFCSPPRYQISFCRGQERTFKPSFESFPPKGRICTIIESSKRGALVLGLLALVYIWLTSESGNPTYSPRPLSEYKVRLIITLCSLSRHKSSKCRGHILMAVLVSTQGVAYFSLITRLRKFDIAGDSAHSILRYLSSIVSQSSTRSGYSPMAQSSWMQQELLGPLILHSSCRGQERSFTSSSSSKERTFSHLALFMGSVFHLISMSKSLVVLTVLFSSVLVRTGPVETTGIIPVRPEVMDLVKRSLAFAMLTKPRLVDEFELKMFSLTGVLVLDSLNTSPKDLSNFVKFVSLSLVYACIMALVVRLAVRVCPNTRTFLVSF